MACLVITFVAGFAIATLVSNDVLEVTQTLGTVSYISIF